MDQPVTQIEDEHAFDALEPLQSEPMPDRLPPMLFLAALVHGILIIGITFNAVLGDEFTDSISLEVTIVADPDKNVEAPEEATYLAQASQLGAGNTDEAARPRARAENDAPIDNAGSEQGSALTDSSNLEESADQLLATRADRDRAVADQPRDDPRTDESIAMRLESGVDVTMPLPQDEQSNPLIQDENPRELVTSVDTRESVIAGYLDRWKRKIETIGIKYFPEKGIMQGLTGSPTLEVTISASGQLEDVVIRRSSGSKILDQAALNILRRAAPFDPFPQAIRVDYDLLRFAYKWQFSEVDVATAARRN